MLSWLKKRCRRQSAPNTVPDGKRVKVLSGPLKHDLQVPSQENLYFTLEDESEYHIYEDIDDVRVNCGLRRPMTSTPSTSKANELGDVWLKKDDVSIFCPVCRVSHERSCECVTSDLDLTTSDIASPLSRSKKGRRTLQGHEISRYTHNLTFDLMADRRRCLLTRCRSDIQDRPLPKIPTRMIQPKLAMSDDDSSGYYDNIDSDSDLGLYEDIGEQQINKCTTV